MVVVVRLACIICTGRRCVVVIAMFVVMVSDM